MDPVTIIGGATLAFNALKKGFQVGKDLQDMSGQLTQWASAMSDLSYAEQKNKNPPWWKALNGQSVEAEALEIFTAKKKAEAMRKELKDWISFSMGPSAWDELVATEGKIRKQKKEQEYRKAEIQEAIITWTVTGLLLASGLSALIFIAWLIIFLLRLLSLLAAVSMQLQPELNEKARRQVSSLWLNLKRLQKKPDGFGGHDGSRL
jgi:hypothetical protein